MGKMDLHQNFLVLRPAGDLHQAVKEKQKLLATKYNLYQRLPMLHVTLLQVQVRGMETCEQLIEQVASVVQKANPIPLYSVQYQCYSFNNRSVTILLQKTPPLLRISQELKASLQVLPGIKFTGPSLEEREFHITLASTLFAENPWSAEVFSAICQQMPKDGSHLSGWASSLEVWRPRLLPQEAILASFSLPPPSGE